MLRDAYSFRGILNALRSLATDNGKSIANAAVLEIIGPVLDDMIDADDRFFKRLPPISEIHGIRGRTELVRPVV